MIEIKTDKLKKCPCCGGKANLFYSPYCKDYKILCTRCSIRTCKLATKASAIKSWNRRK